MAFPIPWWGFALATAVLASLNFWLDRVVMKDVHDAATVAALHGLVSVPPLAAYALLANVAWPSADLWGWVLLRGLLFTAFGIYFLKGVRSVELTLNGALSRLRVAFVIILSAVVLGEALTLVKLAALALVFAGAVIATSSKGKSLRAELKNPGVRNLAIASFLIACCVLVDKHLAGQYEPVTYTAAYLGLTAIFTFAITPNWYSRAVSVLKSKPRAFLLRAFILPGSQLGSLFAYQLAQASLVALVTELSIPFSFILAVWWLGERENLKRRALGGLLVVIASTLAIFG